MAFKIMEGFIRGELTEPTLIEQPTYEDFTETIYHYTSPAGLLGILSEDTIKSQFTRYDLMHK